MIKVEFLNFMFLYYGLVKNFKSVGMYDWEMWGLSTIVKIELIVFLLELSSWYMNILFYLDWVREILLKIKIDLFVK